MKTTLIAITRKFNLGNYQTMDISVEASLGEEENAKEGLHALEKVIMDYWEGRTASLISNQVGKKEEGLK